MLLSFFACTGVDAPDDSVDTGEGALAACLSEWSDGVTEPYADGPDTQIHGTSTFDGRHVWMAWSIPNEHSTFDIQLARYACDGVMDLGPIDVTSRQENDVDPALGVDGDEVVVAWTVSTSTGISIAAAGFQDGAEVWLEDPIQPTAEGALLDGNSVGPVIEEGWLAGSFSNADTTGFQAVRVPLGQWDEGQAPGFDAAVSQTEVDVADGVLVWQQDSVEGGPSTIWRDGTQIAEGKRPSIGGFVAWDDDAGTATTSDGRTRDDGFHHSAAVAGDVWLTMRVDSGIYNDLVLDDVEIDAGNPSVYGVDVTLVGQDHALVVWQTGDNPDFRLRAQWISL